MVTGGCSRPDPDSRTRRLAAEAIAAGDPTAWFERLYASAARGEDDVPWDRNAPTPWRLTRAELESVAGDELSAQRIEEIPDPSGASRWRASFVRPA